MVDNKLKVGLGLLTVLATPFAVNVVAGSEVHAAEQKSAVVEKSATAEKSVAENKQNVTEKPVVAEKSDNKAVVADKKVTEKSADNKKTEAIGKQKIVEKSLSEENKTESVKQVENKENTLPKEGGKPSDGKEEQDKTGYDKGIFYDNGKLANWWYDDGQDWYFFQNGKKHTGEGKDNAGNHYFVNGKYANGYQKDTYYVNGKLADWWLDDGQDWYFFKNGKKFTGEASDSAGKHLFTNGKYANGIENGLFYVRGKKANGYEKGTYYVDGKLADWWLDDGKDWYFFKNGLKYTGEANDSAGKHYFVNGKYANGTEKGIYYVNGKVANGYENGIYYVNGKLGDWWLDDGKDWYFFKNGKKFTGVAKDSSGEHKFINGKYAAATGNGSDGLSNVLSIAQSYLGVEMGSAEHKKIVDAYNSVNPKPVGYTVKYSDDWCDVFVTTVFQQAGLSSLIGRECGVQRHIGIMQQKGIWQGKVLPKAGDVITFDWDGGGFADHIGIVESVKDGVVTTIEGNSSPYTSSGNTKVNRKTYNWNASYIKGYARPNY